MVRSLLFAVLSVSLIACGEMNEGFEPNCDDGCDEVVSAYCEVSIEGFTSRDVELEYLPNVLACENETGGFESLKAQAIAARSYLYYKLNRRETISNSESDQVFSCGREPSALHLRAVEETSGIVLRYQSKQVVAFFVAGALQRSANCRGGTSDPTSTERFVTYNQGRSGTDLIQSSLGFRDPKNYQNRGCMSQHGANCLSDQGETAADIIHFYYGDDIGIETAVGSCIVPGAIFGASSSDSGVAAVGNDCSDDNLRCNFEADGVSGQCVDWFDYSTAELYGFCSLACDGDCAIFSREGETYCAQLASGGNGGQCVLVPSAQNGDCEDVAGTSIQVMPNYTTAGASTMWRGVCVPPGNGTACVGGNGQSGQCIDENVSTCDGQIHPSACPGGSNIRCCTP